MVKRRSRLCPSNPPVLEIWRKSCAKRSFWRRSASLLEEVSYETLVLEKKRFTCGGSLRNARFGDLALHFWSKPRTKRWFWRLAHFWRKSCGKRWFWRLGAFHFRRNCRTKRSFWRLGASLLEELSYEALVVETWRFTFGGSLVRNARFGDLALHFWRKSRTKRSFWRLGASLLEVSRETLVLETWRFTFGGSLLRNAHLGDLARHLWSWTQTWPFCSANVVRERALVASL